jgi:4-diphosphocytidyl-2-C-methyl-D-erythritol kinase
VTETRFNISPLADIGLLAPAKLNLFLEVTGQREDGYHLIESLIAFLDIGDLLYLKAAERSSLTVTGPFASGVPSGGDNLVMKALRLLERLSGRALPVAVTLEKRIPSGAGLGGGSADAAALLQGLPALYGLDIDDTVLRGEALALGADLPACLEARPVLVGGIGEILEPFSGLPAFPAVVVHPGKSLSTPDVYRAYDQAHRDCACCRGGAAFPPLSVVDALAQRRNDLEHAAIALEPAVAEVLTALSGSEGCLLARMSGSGSAAFGLFADDGAAQQAAVRLAARHPRWWVEAAHLSGSLKRAA